MSDDLDRPKRRFWQVHLLTGIIIMVQAGLLIPMFIEVYASDRDDRLLWKTGAYGLFVIGLSMAVVENVVRAFERKSIQFLAGIAVILLGAMTTRWMTAPIRMTSNHRRAVAACKDFAEAEEIYHRLDTSGSGCLYYAKRLSWLFGENGSLGLISAEFANAEADYPGPAVPNHGYLFKVLKAQGAHAPGGSRKYESNGINGGVEKKSMALGYALVAFPTQYSITGQKTFIINGNGTIYEKDLGSNTTKLASEMTEYDPDPSWAPLESGR